MRLNYLHNILLHLYCYNLYFQSYYYDLTVYIEYYYYLPWVSSVIPVQNKVLYVLCTTPTQKQVHSDGGG